MRNSIRVWGNLECEKGGRGGFLKATYQTFFFLYNTRYSYVRSPFQTASAVYTRCGDSSPQNKVNRKNLRCDRPILSWQQRQEHIYIYIYISTTVPQYRSSRRNLYSTTLHQVSLATGWHQKRKNPPLTQNQTSCDLDAAEQSHAIVPRPPTKQGATLEYFGGKLSIHLYIRILAGKTMKYH